MNIEQCKKCGRYSYRDGRCYADKKMKGRPIGEYTYCEWATPKEALPGRLLKPRKRIKKATPRDPGAAV